MLSVLSGGGLRQRGVNRLTLTWSDCLQGKGQRESQEEHTADRGSLVALSAAPHSDIIYSVITFTIVNSISDIYSLHINSISNIFSYALLLFILSSISGYFFLVM